MSIDRCLRYFQGYSAETIGRVRALIDAGRLDAYLTRRYPDRHQVRSDAALYDYAHELKQQHLRSAPPLHKVVYQNRLDVVRNALGSRPSARSGWPRCSRRRHPNSSR